MSRSDGKFGRHATSALLTVGLALGGLAVPVVPLAVPAATAVAPEIDSVRLAAVDEEARADPTADDLPLGHAHDAHEADDHAGDHAEPGAGHEGTRLDAGASVRPGRLAALSPRTATRVFLVAGVTWDGTSGEDVTEVALRVRESGTWSEWQSVGVEEAQVPGARAGTEPYVTAGADAVQARVRTASGRAPSGMRVDVIDPGVSPADASIGASTAPAASADAATGQEIKPSLVSRRQWGADESLADEWRETSGKLKAMYVHHTAGTNSYSRYQSAAIVRGIYAYHTQSNGWPDIGYQFLVDRFGRIFTGRRNAELENPIGAQAGGYNSGTIGVSAMGNFVAATPPSALVAGISRVMAWKAYQYGVDPRGTVSLRTADGSSTAKAPPGTIVRVPRILGHGHTNQTACPGGRLAARLDTIRSSVRSRVIAAYQAHGAVRATPAKPSTDPVGARLSPVQWTAHARFSWDPVRGAEKYQVLTRSGRYDGDRPHEPYWWVQKTTADTRTTVYTEPGENVVYGVRAVLPDGRRGPAKIITATTRELMPGTWDVFGWRRMSDSGYHHGYAYRTSSQGSDIKIYRSKGITQVRVVAPTGRGWGRIGVYVAGTRYGVIDLASSAPADQKVFTVRLGDPRSGRIVLRALDAQEVRVSGIGVVRP
jgi:hypothetical protein